MLKFVKPSVLAMTFLSVSFSASAAGIVATQTAERQIIVITETGETQIEYKPADLVSPGEVVKFSIQYENQDSVAADKPVLIMPIPKTMNLLDVPNYNDASKRVLLSYDDGANYLDADVTPVNFDPRTMNVTHVKWVFSKSIAPNSSGQVSALARLK